MTQNGLQRQAERGRNAGSLREMGGACHRARCQGRGSLSAAFEIGLVPLKSGKVKPQCLVIAFRADVVLRFRDVSASGPFIALFPKVDIRFGHAIDR